MSARYPIPILLVTYNRLGYSFHAYESIVQGQHVPIELTIWDNASTDGTHAWLRYLRETCPVPLTTILNEQNRGLAPAMNYMFRRYQDASFVVKVDNDTVLPRGWLIDLLSAFDAAADPRIGAISPTCMRPNGHTFQSWVDECMTRIPCAGHELFFNSYVAGTGVLINMDMIRVRGLLFEGMPCKLAGWTDYTRIASEFDGWKFAFYSGVHMKLLNLEAEHVLSGDYPEYDDELREMRGTGDKWWTSVGGMTGVRKMIEDAGGHVPLQEPVASMAVERNGGPALTRCENKEERSTRTYWESRVKDNGVGKSIFLETKQSRIEAFTRRHDEILTKTLPGKDVLEIGAGWGRLSFRLGKIAKSYIGTDFVFSLVQMAKRSLPGKKFVAADARALPFRDQSFDVIVGVTCISSLEFQFESALEELKRVLRPDGIVLFLEEEWARADWKGETA